MHDSGATDHVVNSLSFFKEYTTVSDKSVKLPNGETVQVSHVGTVQLNSDLVLFNDTKTWKMIGLAEAVNGLYHLRLETSYCFPEVATACNVSHSSSNFVLWHFRLGHPSIQRMKHFSSLEASIPVDSTHTCDICHLAKHKRLPFPTSVSISDSVFDLVHLDVWGPFPVKSLYGHHYFLTIVDDKSRHLWVYPMKQKSEVRELITNFCKMVETQFSRNIKCIRTDNAKEFDMDAYFNSKGILHQNSCVHTPQQNNIVERKHQHLLNVARSLRIQSGLPLVFWIDCVLHAAYLINVTPTPVLHNKTPFEVLFQKPPKLGHLKVFGSLAYASVLPKPHTKLDARAVKCIFIGYPRNIKGFRLFDIEKHVVFVSRDVVFSENVFPFLKHDSVLSNNVFPRNECSNLSDVYKGSKQKTVINKTKTGFENSNLESENLGDKATDIAIGTPTEGLVSNNTNIDDTVSHDAGSNEVQSSKDSVDSNLVLSRRSTRNRQIPKHLQDYEVNLPAVRKSPHTIAQGKMMGVNRWVGYARDREGRIVMAVMQATDQAKMMAGDQTENG
ncbi:hypothetical protein GQ457_15G024750 [Hibiscus cannabinus]